MEEHEAIRIATEFSRDCGRETDDYDVLSIREIDGTVFILFQGKSGQPGDHFSVHIDAFTGKVVRLVSGR